MTTTPPRARTGRLEGLVLVAILVLVSGFAGAASFTHVKDWTLANSPAGTGEWFGWANAVISELVPIAALLTIRRRKRAGQPIGYPLALLIAAAGLSLAAQLAVAKPGLSGWLLSAVPALAFMALVKLVLAPVPAADLITAEVIDPHNLCLRLRNRPCGLPLSPSLRPPPLRPEVPAHLLTVARFAVVNHEQTTGRPITAEELAVRMSITPVVAGQLITSITGRPEPTQINGAPVLSGGAR